MTCISRCLDPSELGSFVASIKCSECEGQVLKYFYRAIKMEISFVLRKLYYCHHGSEQVVDVEGTGSSCIICKFFGQKLIKFKNSQENEGIEHPYQVVDVERTGSSWQCSKCNEAVSKDRVDQVRYHPYPVSTFKNGHWRYC